MMELRLPDLLLDGEGTGAVKRGESGGDDYTEAGQAGGGERQNPAVL